MECTKVEKKQQSFAVDATKIRTARAEKDWTKLKLAEEAKLSRKTVEAIEKNKHSRLHYETIEKIANALGKRVEDFMVS